MGKDILWDDGRLGGEWRRLEDAELGHPADPTLVSSSRIVPIVIGVHLPAFGRVHPVVPAHDLLDRGSGLRRIGIVVVDDAAHPAVVAATERGVPKGAVEDQHVAGPVSYTHLTLPTKRIV